MHKNVTKIKIKKIMTTKNFGNFIIYGTINNKIKKNILCTHTLDHLIYFITSFYFLLKQIKKPALHIILD